MKRKLTEKLFEINGGELRPVPGSERAMVPVGGSRALQKGEKSFVLISSSGVDAGAIAIDEGINGTVIRVGLVVDASKFVVGVGKRKARRPKPGGRRGQLKGHTEG